MNYKQCTVYKRQQESTVRQTTYLPEKFAVQNMVLRLKNDDDVWENGWVVESVGSPVDETLLPDYRKAIRNHKKNTGDSLPKNFTTE